jgi:hypothetical protein
LTCGATKRAPANLDDSSQQSGTVTAGGTKAVVEFQLNERLQKTGLMEHSGIALKGHPSGRLMENGLHIGMA